MKVGDKFSVKFNLSEQIYIRFLENFRDNNILHVNDSYAVKKGFKSKVVHGNILNGFISYFIGMELPISNVMIVSQKINYKKPSYINDEITMNSTITDYFGSVNLYEIKFKFYNQNNSIISNGIIQLKEI